MTILTDNPIPQLVARYRKLKVSRDSIDREMNAVKEQLMPAVEASGGKWTDDQGFARIVKRKESVSYPGAEVDRLATIWSESDDPIMQSCGKTLIGLHKQKAGYSYLQVK